MQYVSIVFFKVDVLYKKISVIVFVFVTMYTGLQRKSLFFIFFKEIPLNF